MELKAAVYRYHNFCGGIPWGSVWRTASIRCSFVSKGEFMAKKYGFVLPVMLLFAATVALRSEDSCAKDKKLAPEEIVAKHLESIGTAEALSAVKSRTVYGVCAVQRPIGTVPLILPEPDKRTEPSNFLFASTGNNLGMIMKFYDQVYPGEHFAFDGKDTTIKITTQNNKSILGNFINSYSGMMREGLLGGAWSTAWPLLNLKEGKFKLRYKLTDTDGIKQHQLTYAPKSNRFLVNVVIHLYFSVETYRHVMTEYILMGSTQPALIVLERFGNFKTVDGLTLPYSYSIEYIPWRETRSTLWRAEARQISHGESIDPQIFHVQ